MSTFPDAHLDVNGQMRNTEKKKRVHFAQRQYVFLLYLYA